MVRSLFMWMTLHLSGIQVALFFSSRGIWQCVRGYSNGISYRDLEEMMEERGVSVDHTTLYRWVQHYAPEMGKRLLGYRGY